jgi:hypothetical protein
VVLNDRIGRIPLKNSLFKPEQIVAEEVFAGFCRSRASPRRNRKPTNGKPGSVARPLRLADLVPDVVLVVPDLVIESVRA